MFENIFNNFVEIISQKKKIKNTIHPYIKQKVRTGHIKRKSLFYS